MHYARQHPALEKNEQFSHFMMVFKNGKAPLLYQNHSVNSTLYSPLMILCSLSLKEKQYVVIYA